MTFISVFTASPEHVLLTVENTSTLSGGRKFLSNMKEGEGTTVRKVRFSHFPFFGRGVDPADRKANETGPWELSAAFFFTPVTCPSQASSVSLSYPSLIISYHFLLLSCSPVYSLTLPYVLLHAGNYCTADSVEGPFCLLLHVCPPALFGPCGRGWVSVRACVVGRGDRESRFSATELLFGPGQVN